MQEVDRALARYYGNQDGPPPNPNASPTPAHRPGPGSRRGAARGGGTPPAPHFAVEPSEFDHQAPPLLEWPETVRALERAHGERFEALAERLIQVRDRQNLKVLLFTSCHRAEGRTTLVLTLARALARRPGRNLLVDADLSGPMLARQLGLHPRFGLDDLVESGVPAAEALIEATEDNLTVLPLRAAVSRPRDFLASPGWTCLMARLRREFDLVLLDGSPLFTGLSATALHRSVDAAVLVHNRTLTGERALLRAREVLEAGGIPLLGLAETFV